MKRIAMLLLCLVVAMSAMAGCSAANTINKANADADVQSQTEPAVVETPVVEESAQGVVSDAAHPQVTIAMENEGTMVLELYPEVAPNTVNNFISLAQKGFYNGLIFHRVIKDFMIQGGDPTGTGMGGPDYSIKGEFKSNKFDNPLKHEKGVISMARAQAYDSAGSQFFIMHGTVAQLDGDYAAFGKVIEGIDVVNAIATTPTDTNDRPLKDMVIKEITVDLMGYDFKEPEVIK